jgi:type II secretion system protein G
MKRGFTLIELLVVVAIIGMLSSVVLSSLNTARGNARDARRLADMKQIRTALELFHNEYGRYPDSTEGLPSGGETIGTGGAIDTALQPFINPVPKDPLHDGSTYYYAYDYIHCITGGPSGPVFGFYEAEQKDDIKDDTNNCGGDMGLNVADYAEAPHL